MPTARAASVFDMLIYTAWEAVDLGDIARNDAALLVQRTVLHGLAKPDSSS